MKISSLFVDIESPAYDGLASRWWSGREEWLGEEEHVSIGETLAAARAEAGLTTAEVAESTRIRRTLVEAIEADDYRLCGGDVYTRGHIGTIARTVGLDPAPLLAEFDSSHLETAPSPSRIFESETASRAERRGPNWVAAMVVALVVLVGVGIWQVAAGPDNPRETVTGVFPDVTTSPPVESAPPEQTPSPSPTNTDIAEVPADGVEVVVRAQGGRSWIAVIEGNRQVFTGPLEAGKTMTFKDNAKVKLVVGNAGAIRLTVNGTDLGAPGGFGEVARLTFGPGDPTAAG